MSKILFFLFAISALLFVGCDTTETGSSPPEDDSDKLELIASELPFILNNDSGVTFYSNISYGADERHVFDFFMPPAGDATALCILIHGGGFLSGDKTVFYENAYPKQLINNLLAENIAIAAINYRFVQSNDTEGFIKSLNDAKYALQFIRYYATTLNFDKSRVALYGSSAGASTALWIGLRDNMAEPNSENLILRESTRVQGFVSNSTQSNLDILEWHNNVYASFQDAGFTYETTKSIIGEPTIFAYLGVETEAELFSDALQARRDKVNMLKHMSSDDPEFFIQNTAAYDTIPTTKSEIYHHPLHAKALKDRASEVGATGVFYAPQINIDTRNGENPETFILRKLGH